MGPEQKRKMVSEAYSGDSWRDKVSKMSDAQVHTIYMRLLNKGHFAGKTN